MSVTTLTPPAKFTGIIPPLVTLFDERERVDEAAMQRHVERLVTAGVHAVFALGTTGECMHLTEAERRLVAELVVDQVRGRIPVLIGCNATATKDVIAFAAHAARIGASGAVVITPYYWVLSDEGVEAHFSAVAERVELPILIYNFPSVTGRNLPPNLIGRLAAKHANIRGVKETLDSIAHIQEVLSRVRHVRDDFSMLCGYEYHLINTILLGGDGAVPGMANVNPTPLVTAYDALRRGDVQAATAQMRRRVALAELYHLGAPSFVLVKEAMALAGLIAHPTVRLPALPLSEERRRQLQSVITPLI